MKSTKYCVNQAGAGQSLLAAPASLTEWQAHREVHFWDLWDPHDPCNNNQNKGSLSENVTKDGERVLFQPFHRKRNRRGLRCGHCGIFWEFLDCFWNFSNFFPKDSLLSQISNSKDWPLYWASKEPLFGD